MAIVSKKFRDDFNTWAAYRTAKGDWTESEIDEFKETLRADLAPGPDHLRAGLSVTLAAGVMMPATIDDHVERYQMWSDYFDCEAAAIHCANSR